MKRWLAAFSISLLFGACNALQKSSNKSMSEYKSDTESSLKQSSLNESDERFEINDSLGMATTIRIWPKGFFSYSPADGFMGQANRIELSTKAQQVIRLREDKKSKKEAYLGTKSTQHDIARQQVVQRTAFKLGNSAFYWLFGLILITILIWRFKLFKGFGR